MQEAPKLVDLRPDLDLRTRVLIQILLMLSDLLRELGCLRAQLVQCLTLLEHLEVLLLVGHLCLLGNLLLNVLDEILHSVQRCLREVFAGRGVLLDALKVFDRLLGIDALLIDDRLQLIVLLVHFLHNFFFDALLALHSVCHL